MKLFGRKEAEKRNTPVSQEEAAELIRKVLESR